MPLQDFMELYKSDHFTKPLKDLGGYTVTAAVVSEAITTENPTPHYRLVRGVCHACVRAVTAIPMDYVITATDPTFSKNKGALIFYDWLLNHSALREVFVVKDPALALEKGIVKNTTTDSSLWLAAAQLSRLTTSEFKSRFQSVCSILEEGYQIHPLLLLIVAVSLEVEIEGDGNGQKVYLSKANSTVNSRSLLYNPTAHLPLPQPAMMVEGLLKAYCEDQPPVSAESKMTMKANRAWSGDSALAMIRNKSVFPAGSTLPLLKAFLSSSPCIVGKRSSEEVKEAKATFSLWQTAVDRLKKELLVTNTVGAGSFFDAKKLEAFSKNLNLGASNV